MANVDLAFGFVATPLLRARPYSVGATNATILYINDVVALEATGNMVSAAAASTLIIGSVLGYTKVSTGVDLPVADARAQERGESAVADFAIWRVIGVETMWNTTTGI
jgi:hypothetical protein